MYLPYRMFSVLFLFVSSCLVSLSFTGCASNPPLKLPDPPQWVRSQKYQKSVQENRVIFARGQANNQTLISQRRALAEADAVKNARQSMIQSHPQSKELINKLPWAELSQVESRFFDAPSNIQYTLIRISFKKCKQWVQKFSGYDSNRQTQVIQSLEKIFLEPVSVKAP